MQKRPAIIVASLCAAVLMLMALAVSATDDSSIQGMLRPQIWAIMDEYLLEQMPYGTMRLYDPIENKVLELEIRGFSEKIVREGDFYVTCTHFVDQDRRKIDLDFLILHGDKTMRVTQTVIHKIDGLERGITLTVSGSPTV
jgi:hypothetical protein